MFSGAGLSNGQKSGTTGIGFDAGVELITGEGSTTLGASTTAEGDGVGVGLTITFLNIGFFTTFTLLAGFLTLEKGKFAWDGTAETNKTEIDNNKTLSLNTLLLISSYINYNQ